MKFCELMKPNVLSYSQQGVPGRVFGWLNTQTNAAQLLLSVNLSPFFRSSLPCERCEIIGESGRQPIKFELEGFY